MKKLTSFLVALFLATTALWAAFIPAAFTVSEGKQVAFSQGNLQYTQSTSTWSFAENQYDMLGADNVSGSALADKIDLFGWSANNETAKWGISLSTTTSDYSGDFVDWGTNTIGTAAPNAYRTLTKDEWYYLLNTRTDADSKKGVARIKLNDDGTQYANGLILLPDSWADLTDVTFKSGFANSNSEDYYATYQTFTLDQWQKLEAAGAVFLPASGSRYGSSMNYVQSRGRYWSATADGSYYAYSLNFSSAGAYADYRYDRNYGHAVRLVCEAGSLPTALQNAEMVEIYAAAGRIYGADGMQIFTLTGQNVTEMNGSLNGVYIVKVGDKAQKVVVSSK